jgi:hypothetical protein
MGHCGHKGSPAGRRKGGPWPATHRRLVHERGNLLWGCGGAQDEHCVQHTVERLGAGADAAAAQSTESPVAPGRGGHQCLGGLRGRAACGGVGGAALSGRAQGGTRHANTPLQSFARRPRRRDDACGGIHRRKGYCQHRRIPDTKPTGCTDHNPHPHIRHSPNLPPPSPRKHRHAPPPRRPTADWRSQGSVQLPRGSSARGAAQTATPALPARRRRRGGCPQHTRSCRRRQGTGRRRWRWASQTAPRWTALGRWGPWRTPTPVCGARGGGKGGEVRLGGGQQRSTTHLEINTIILSNGKQCARIGKERKKTQN